MKFNWGTGITIGMILFMGFIITLSVKMIGSKVDLVSKDYYEQGIEFEEHLNQVKAANALSQPVTVDVNYTAAQVQIKLPAEFSNQSVEGTILFFCPNEKNNDFSVALKPDSNLQQNLPLEKLTKGNWWIKLQWKANGKDYYYEEEIVI